jgi:hypothetical protein
MRGGHRRRKLIVESSKSRVERQKITQRRRAARVWRRKGEHDLAVSFDAAESFSGTRAGARVEELIRDVSENGGAPRRDAAFGNQSEEAATLAVGVTIETARGIVQGNADRFRENGDAGVFLGWVHDVPFLGVPPGNLHECQNKGLTKFAFRKCVILKGMTLADQNG